MIVGQELTKLLDEMYSANPRPIQIVETGCLRSTKPEAEEGDGWSTLYIARWVDQHGKDCLFHSIELDPLHALTAIEMLVEDGVGKSCNFLCGQDSVSRLSEYPYKIDFAFLDTSDDLAHGLAEFQAAEAKGAEIIVMDDFATKAERAARYAKQNGWQVTQNGRLTVMKR